MKNFIRLCQVAAVITGLSLFPSKASSITLTFDDLPTEQGVTTNVDFATANNGSYTYDGVTFTSQFRVIGDQYSIGNTAGAPVYGIPNSAPYFLSNTNANNRHLHNKIKKVKK